MAINTDTNSYTVIFSTIMVVVIGSFLAFFATALSDKNGENERLAKQQNILYAMGINENKDANSVNFVTTDKVSETFAKYIKEQLVIEGDKVTKDDEAYLISLNKEEAEAKAGRVRKLPLFVGEKDGKTYYIVPMRGKGLWDAIWGYMALDANMVVQGIYFDHAGETPGLGANIKERYFMDDFTGESILNGNQFAGIAVAKGNNDPVNTRKDDNAVDALAGSTITGNGVSAMIRSTINLYKPYLETIRVKD